MFPGLSPRELRRMLKRMGIDVKEFKNVVEVTIKTSDKEIILYDPQVLILDAGRQKIFQITTAKIEERELEKPAIEFSEDDINFIIEQTGASRDVVIKALEKTGGDIAEAILLIREGRV